MRVADAGGYEGSVRARSGLGQAETQGNSGGSDSRRRQRHWDSRLRWELRETTAASLGEGEI